MENITIQEALKSFGFLEREIKIYLASLELGTATANEIAKKADINRSTTYDILKVFLEKGIASTVVRGKTQSFEVAIPEKLIAILEEKKAKLNAVFNELKLIQQSVIEKPRLKLYEGKEGLKTILEDILVTKQETKVISTSKIFKILTFYFPEYIKRRKKAKMRSRVLQEDSPETKELKSKDKEELRETRSLKRFNINSAIFIYGEKIALIKLVEKEPIGIILTDKTLAQDQTAIFEILWKAAKE